MPATLERPTKLTVSPYSETFLTEVKRTLAQAIAKPHHYQDSVQVKLAAFWQWHNTPKGRVHWDNKFFLAVICNLPYEMQQSAAWALVGNSVQKVLTRETSLGYSLLAAMTHIGIEVDIATDTVLGKGESFGFSYEVMNQVIGRFQLPVSSDPLQLTGQQRALRTTLINTTNIEI